jgi:DNA-directed RNA polymerase subunit RPC12/RpoP
MPQTEKYVCFNCRRVHRSPSGHCYGRIQCSACGRLMLFVGGDFKTPKKRDAAGWRISERWALRRQRPVEQSSNRNHQE